MRQRPGRKLSIFILLFMILTGCSSPLPEIPLELPLPEETFPLEEPVSPEEPAEVSEELTVHFLDVGQGDCTIITQGAHAMLIDAGKNDQGTKIQYALMKLGIDTLDYVVLTHPDADHIGSADVILYKFDCETILMPDMEADTDTYKNMMESLRTKKYETISPNVGDTCAFGEASFTILSPSGNYEEPNNNSIVLKLTHGETSFLFAGDAESKAEQDMLLRNADLSADVLKVGHHGSSDSTKEEFLQAVDPAYAVISCGKGNDYGHPHNETLGRLYRTGATIYRTDEQGTITVTSDGKTLIWNTGADMTEGMEVTYYLNTRSMKIHLPNCKSVQEMADHNRAASYETKEALMEQGYEPCGWCKP